MLPKINSDETEQILKSIKFEVFNEEKNKYEFRLIHGIVDDLSKVNLDLNEIVSSILTIQKKIDPIFFTRKNIKESQLYQYLTEVYPKTQFIASLTVNLSSVLFCTYLLTWAIQSFLTVLGVFSLAAIISSPAVVGLLILAVASFFLMWHLCEFRTRENFYERTILNKIKEKCVYFYRDEHGRRQSIQIEKWEKFEYLQANIQFLEKEFKSFFEKNNSDNLYSQFYVLFNSCISKKIFHNSHEQDRLLGNSNPIFRRLKKFLNRFFAFSGGGLYGYNLAQQIVWKSELGLHVSLKILTLPILLIFIPLIVINGIANLVTYHLHSRQQNRFEMAKNLDSKLEALEQTNKNLLYLAALLNLKLKQSNSESDRNIERESGKVLLTESRINIISETSFFKKISQEKINPVEYFDTKVSERFNKP